MEPHHAPYATMCSSGAPPALHAMPSRAASWSRKAWRPPLRRGFSLLHNGVYTGRYRTSTTLQLRSITSAFIAGGPEGSVPGSLETAWLAGVQETMLGVLSAGSPSAPPADILASQTPPLYCPVRASPSLLSRLLHHVPFSPSAVVVCRLATPFFYFLSIRFLSRDVGCTRSVHIPFTGTSCRFPLLFYARLFFCSRRSGTIFSTVRLAAPEEPSPSSHTHTRHLSHCPAC